MTGVAIPKDASKVGPDWLNLALCRNGGRGWPAVTGLTVEVFEKNAGLFSRLARLRLTWEGRHAELPSSLILKLATDYPTAKSLGLECYFFDREVAFYRDVAPHGRTPAPACYWCDFDAETGDFGILLADLGSLACEDQLTGISRGRLGTTIADLADMHAYWWESTLLDDVHRCDGWGSDYMHDKPERYRRAWPMFAERFGAFMPNGTLRFGDAAADAMHKAMDDLSGRPATLAHGDVKADNLFFGGAPETLVAVDWANMYQVVGTVDLALLLVQSTPVKLRRASQWELLRSWHDRLIAQIDTAYSYEDAIADYRRAALAYLVHPVCAGAYLNLEDVRARRFVTTIAQRAFTAAIDLDLEELL